MQVIDTVIIAVVVGDVPASGEGIAAISRSQDIITSKSESITVKMVGFVFAGINKGSDSPGARLNSVLNNSCRVINGGVVIGAGSH